MSKIISPRIAPIIGYLPNGRPVRAIMGGDENAVLSRLLEQREAQCTFIDQLTARVAEEGRDLVDAELDNLKAARKRITELDAQIEPLEQFEATRSAHRAAIPARQPAAQVAGQGIAQRASLGIQDREQEPYRTAGEFLADYVRSIQYPGDRFPEPDETIAARVRAARGRQVRAAGDVAPGPHQTTDDTPGLLPKPIIGSILNDLDAARPFVGSIGAQNFSPGTGKTWSRPHITQHTLVGEQTAEKAELPSRDLKIEGIDFTKRTYGGHLNISRQEIDWTSPSAWDAVINDLRVQYELHTDDESAEYFADEIDQTVAVGDPDDVADWIRALYAAASKAATANGTKRPSALRMPNHIWVAHDVDSQVGAMLAIARIAAFNPAGTSSVNTFGGNLLDLPRTMVPGFPAGTAVVGKTSMFEFYEERIGLLQAIEPKVFGVDVAYGGYAAFEFLDKTAFAKITGAGS